MDKKLWKEKLTAVDVAEEVIEKVGRAKLRQAKETNKGEDLRAWAKLQIDLYGPEGSERLRDRAATLIIEHIHKISRV